MIYYPIIMTAGAMISAGVSTGVAIWKQKQLDASIEKLSETVTVDVDDAYIHKIVEKAVDKEVKERVVIESRSAVAAIRSDMAQKIQKEINKNYTDLKAQVKAEMEKQLGRIDLDDIRKEIIAEGREEAKKQFKNDLDKIVELQNDNLKNINDIYANIADTLKGNKGTTLTIG